MSQSNHLVMRFRTADEERRRRERWERGCDYLVDDPAPRGHFPSGKPYRRGPLFRIALRPGDVDALLWLTLALLLTIFAATWLPGVR